VTGATGVPSPWDVSTAPAWTESSVNVWRADDQHHQGQVFAVVGGVLQAHRSDAEPHDRGEGQPSGPGVTPKRSSLSVIFGIVRYIVTATVYSIPPSG
jgi:hypothetical protein